MSVILLKYSIGLCIAFYFHYVYAIYFALSASSLPKWGRPHSTLVQKLLMQW